MTARLSLYQKAEQELYRLERSVKADFYNFSHEFRENPRQPGLHLQKLKGGSGVYSARVNLSYRALLTRAGVSASGEESWLVIAVRHRKDVYEQLSVAVNRVNGELEFVDLSVVGQSALHRAGIALTKAEDADTPAPVPTPPSTAGPPLLEAYTPNELRELGVAESLIPLALTVTDSAELDLLVAAVPLLSKDVLYGLAAGLDIDQVRSEITEKYATESPVDTEDFAAALARTTVTTVDAALQAVLDEGDFRAWKVFLHPTQRRLVHRDYSGPARVSGGPGTGKTIVALHRVKYLADRLPEDSGKAILLTTFTKNLATDLRARLASLIDPTRLALVDIVHVDQLATRVVGENATPGRSRNRVDDKVAARELRDMLFELDERSWEPDFLIDEWVQVILGQSLSSRAQYFKARRSGRGRPLTRPERAVVWNLVEQFSARLDKLGIETWAQAADRAARTEIDRAARIATRRADGATAGGEPIRAEGDSGARYRDYRYKHIVVDEAQDLRPAHWKMLRAMVEPGVNDMFIAGDTHQRIYDNQVALGALGVNIRGRASRLTLSYRTTKEILASALTMMSGETFDDLDDGNDTLAGYRSVLHGPPPAWSAFATWRDELDGLAVTIETWWNELATDEHGTSRDPRGLIAVCVAERDKVDEVMHHLTAKTGITCAELTKEGPRGDGKVHVGTMHRFKGLEYQKLAVVAAADGIVPRASIERFRTQDPARYGRERRKARSLLFVAATRARDSLSVSWHGARSPFLPRP
ncbi:UvrD-helicase domain-containing protein [Embleya sp. NPDC055664]